MDNKNDLIDKINEKFQKLGIDIWLEHRNAREDYDDNRVYRTGERSLDVRLDRMVVLG